MTCVRFVFLSMLPEFAFTRVRGQEPAEGGNASAFPEWGEQDEGRRSVRK